MTPRRETPTTYLPLTPYVFQILLALADGEKHGYAILKDVRDRTGGTVRLGTGTLYTAIKRLLEREWIERCSDEADRAHEGSAAPRGPSYGLTKLGLAVARAEAERLELVLSVARERRLLRQGGIVPEEGR